MAERPLSAEELARRRYHLITLVNFAGAGLALVGALIAGGRWDGAPEWLGGGLMVAALLVFFLLPNRLRARWKSRDGEL